MQNSVTKRSLILILAIVMVVSTIFLYTTEQSYAYSGYVTAKIGIGYKGSIPVYKTASTATQWTYKDSSNKVYKGMISRNVYLTYLGRSGNFLKVKWGDLEGYISDTQGVYTDSLPVNATRLTSRKRVTFGIYEGYMAYNTYVIYLDKSAGKIKWAPNADLPAPEEKWLDPIAYLHALS